jgi:hypothetical protein
MLAGDRPSGSETKAAALMRCDDLPGYGISVWGPMVKAVGLADTMVSMPLPYHDA